MKLLEIMDMIYDSIYNKDIYDPEFDTNCTVKKVGRKLYVSFRPTVGELGSKNWHTNFDFFFGKFNIYNGKKKKGKCKVKFNNMSINVHGGFLDAFLSMSSEIQKRIEAESDYDVIVFVGHSLGGALANLAYLWFGYPNGMVVTTGCPRFVGFLSAMRIHWFYKKNIHRIVNDFDIMTKLPPFLFGFKHIGNKIQIGNPWNILGSFKGWNENSHTQHNYKKSLQEMASRGIIE